MESFVCGGKEIVFWQVAGEVIGTNKFNETHVSSSGGGGYVGQYGGYVSAPTIRSASVTNHELWIRTEDGHEQDIKFCGVDIPLRVGQKITLIAAKKKGSDTGCYSILVNHNTRQHWFINNAERLRKNLFNTLLNRWFKKSNYIAMFVVFVVFAALVSERILPDYALYAPIFLATIAVYINKIRNKFLNNSLDNHLEKLAQLTY